MNKQLMVFLVLFLMVFFRSFIIEPNSLVVTKYEIPDTKLRGTRVVFFSDLNLKKRDYKRLSKIVKMTNAQQPDIVLIGGDFYKSKKYKDSMKAETLALRLSDINAPVFTVLGDNDWLNDTNTIISNLKESGIYVLENQNKRIIIRGRYIDIVGLADFKSRRQDYESSFRRTKLPRIVITHNPDIYYNIMDEASIIFAGHTHGGQFIIPFTPPLFVPSKFGAQFASGIIRATGNIMIITKGIGTEKWPARLNCKPEIVVVDFVKE